jgi:hypothetical protein
MAIAGEVAPETIGPRNVAVSLRAEGLRSFEEVQLLTPAEDVEYILSRVAMLQLGVRLELCF